MYGYITKLSELYTIYCVKMSYKKISHGRLNGGRNKINSCVSSHDWSKTSTTLSWPHVWICNNMLQKDGILGIFKHTRTEWNVIKLNVFSSTFILMTSMLLNSPFPEVLVICWSTLSHRNSSGAVTIKMFHLHRTLYNIIIVYENNSKRKSIARN